MGKEHHYRMTEAHMDHLMTLSGDQLVTIITRLTDRTVSILLAICENGAIPKETQELFGLEEVKQNKTHLLGSITDLGAGVKEGCCSDECWCQDTTKDD